MLSNYLIDPKDFEEEKNIGSGNFSNVMLVHSKKKPKNKYAVKSMQLDDEENQKYFLREISIMSSVRHPTLLKMKGFSIPNKKDPVCRIYTEFMSNGTLLDILKVDQNQFKESNKVLGPTEKSKIIYGIVAGMAYLHKENIIHRDLKPENIFLDNNYEPVISDFGLSRFTENDVSVTRNLGTPYFMAPEMFESTDDIPVTEKIDVYAFALVLYALFDIHYVFEKNSPRSIGQLYLHIKKGMRYVIPANTPKYFEDLIRKCWSNDIKQRPSFQEILDDFDENENYILPGANREDVLDYVDYIKSSERDLEKLNKSISSEFEVHQDFDFDNQEIQNTEEFDFL
ncbi:hypothetical protein TRFO_34764 [Tritrichomonas foetus]|uniref:Protein kinase domain-containing protein n=1 Tax=Tritrichomonas foetus TaxID=1144522 RepID=A0A1J4JJW1_9EUKA|nr:hypothetical protein TRFO_34764 [Tritrichomonas foetus]|eukprot:OHS98897.1 hypothetical protein TRFO_34764 [Tritrichomonas foetus]